MGIQPQMYVGLYTTLKCRTKAYSEIIPLIKNVNDVYRTRTLLYTGSGTNWISRKILEYVWYKEIGYKIIQLQNIFRTVVDNKSIQSEAVEHLNNVKQMYVKQGKQTSTQGNHSDELLKENDI